MFKKININKLTEKEILPKNEEKIKLDKSIENNDKEKVKNNS